MKDMYNEMIGPYKKTALFILILIIIAYLSLIFLPRDNPIEQATEKVIEQETGLSIDLTP